MSIKPFSEVALFELGNESEEFYATGSSPAIGDGSFTSALSNKVQIKLALSVKNKVSMLGNSSSIYYFNVGAGQWNIPTAAVSDHAGPFDKFSFRTIGGNFDSSVFHPNNKTYGTTQLEDAIGFDCFGNTLASGSLNVRRQVAYPESAQSFAEIFTSFDQTKQADLLTLDCPKSVQRNQDYDPSSTQTFVIPVTEPFLIEKVVFEVPFCFGDSWFNDYTVSNLVSASKADYLLDGSSANIIYPFYDSGGPRLSIALYSQKNYGTSSIRDLICHDVITHTEDAVTDVRLNSELEGTSNNAWSVTTVGLDEAQSPTSVFAVSGTIVSGKKMFTGSVVVKSKSSVTNGVKVLSGLTKSYVSSPSNLTDIISFYSNLLSSELVKINDLSSFVTGIDPMGRGMTGFSPSGGSVFGKEYVTSQGKIDIKGRTKNPFYISDASKRSTAVADFTSRLTANPSNVSFFSTFTFSTKESSPYLMLPGEKLVLVAAKHRPSFRHIKANISTSDLDNGKLGRGSLLSSSYYNNLKNPAGHDVQFNTGTINITFYGSYVQEGGQYIP